MDDDILQRLQQADSANEDTNSQITDSVGTQNNTDVGTSDQSANTGTSFAFFTAAEAGIQPQDPNDIPAAPRPQPGMTFTPTGGSVSKIAHQTDDDDTNIITPDIKPPKLA